MSRALRSRATTRSGAGVEVEIARIPPRHAAPVAGNRAFVVQVSETMIGQRASGDRRAAVRNLVESPGGQRIAHFEHQVPVLASGMIVLEDHEPRHEFTAGGWRG